MRPQLSWNPIRYIDSMLEEGRPALEEWFSEAGKFGLHFIEIYQPLLKSLSSDYLEMVRKQLEALGLRVSMLTCAPDFTHPDPDQRRWHFEDMLRNLEAARVLGAPCIRTTTGCAHPEVERSTGIGWCTDALLKLSETAGPLGVTIAIENHYKDRRWTLPDFSQHAENFLAVFDRVRDSAVRVNFDTSNQVMVNEDPMTILNEVKRHIVHVHANDRLPGSYQHTVVGEGRVDWDAIFTAFRDVNYTGCISLEDGTGEGEEGTRKSFAFLRKKIDEYYL